MSDSPLSKASMQLLAGCSYHGSASAAMLMQQGASKGRRQNEMKETMSGTHL